MQRRLYPRPPIVEAIIQFQFAQPIGRRQLDKTLRHALRAAYPGLHRTQAEVQVTAQVGPDSVSASAARRVKVVFLQATNGLRLVGLADGVLSIHALAPYPGWENFMANTEEVVVAASSEFGRQPLAGITVRYIDRIVFPERAADLSRYLTLQLGSKTTDDGVITAFSMLFQRVVGIARDVTTLAIAAAPGEPDGRPAIVLDVVAATSSLPVCSLADVSSWRSVVQRLHQLQRDAFEAAITDATRELFQ